MKEIALGIMALLAIGMTLALLRNEKKINRNGVCNVECNDCSENNWCIFKQESDNNGCN